MLLNKNNEMNTEPIRQDKSKAKIAQLLVKQDSQLLNFLIQELKGKSRTTVKSLLAHRQVSLGAQPVTQFDFPLKKGQTVTINWGKVSEQVRLRGLRILFEDPYIIVVEKAAGILSIATAKEKLLTAYSILSDYVKRDNPENRIFVIHRLDRDTSGVMMFARSEEIQSVLQRAWQDMVVERTYSAIVEGQVESDEGTIRLLPERE
jgi:Pseudouridylate synthases, 23S RNA-specific